MTDIPNDWHTQWLKYPMTDIPNDWHTKWLTYPMTDIPNDWHTQWLTSWLVDALFTAWHCSSTFLWWKFNWPDQAVWLVEDISKQSWLVRTNNAIVSRLQWLRIRPLKLQIKYRYTKNILNVNSIKILLIFANLSKYQYLTKNQIVTLHIISDNSNCTTRWMRDMQCFVCKCHKCIKPSLAICKIMMLNALELSKLYGNLYATSKNKWQPVVDKNRAIKRTSYAKLGLCVCHIILIWSIYKRYCHCSGYVVNI